MTKVHFAVEKQYTQADIDAGLADDDVAVWITVVDTDGLPTGVIKGSGAAGSTPSTIATEATVQTAVAAGLKKVAITQPDIALTRETHANSVTHIEQGGSFAALLRANWPTAPGEVDKFYLQNHTDAAIAFAVTTGVDEFAGLVDFDEDPVEDDTYSIPSNAQALVMVDSDGWVQIGLVGGAVTHAEASTWLAGKQDKGDVLDDLNELGVSTADGQFLVATDAGSIAWESGDTARTSLGLGSADSPNFADLTIKNVPADFANTGLIEGGDISINVDDTLFNVDPGSAAKEDRTDPANPILAKFSWDAQTGLSTPYLTTKAGTWIGINSEGVVQTSALDFTAEQLRSIVRLGRLSHFGRTAITGTYYFPLFYSDELDWAFRTMCFGTVLLGGNKISANGANLKIDRSIGTCQRIGANARVSVGGDLNNPHTPTTPSAAQTPFLRAHRDGADNTTIEGSFTDLNPNQVDLGDGSLGSVGMNKWTILTAYFFPQGAINTTFMLYGQEIFNSFLAADTVAASYTPSMEDDIAGGVIIGKIVIEQGTTDLAAAIAAGTASIHGGNIWGVSSNGAGAGAGALIWNRVGTVVSPLNAGDDVVLNAGETLSIVDMTAEQIVETDGGKTLISVAKGTAYNKAFGDSAGDVLEGNSARVPTGNAGAADGAAVLAAALTQGYVAYADAAGNLQNSNLFSNGTELGVGTTAVPRGGIGMAFAAIHGGVASGGPHVQYTISLDDYPVFQHMVWAHDDVGLCLDCYYQGGWKRSDLDSAYLIYKNNNKLAIRCAGSGDQGSGILWSTAIEMNTAGQVDVPEVYNETTTSAANVFVASDGSLQRSITETMNWKRTATAVSLNTSNDTVIYGVTDTSAARTVTLDTDDLVAGRIIVIKDESGGAGTNNITIDTEGAATIDGVSSVSITVDYGVVRLYSNGTNWFSI